MPNPHPPLTNLKPQTPKWQHLPTKALRVPEVFLEEIADFAKKLDHGELSAPSLQHPAKITLTRSPLVWLGIKPSISKLGWAVLEGKENDSTPLLLDYGTIETTAQDALPQRLVEIEGDLLGLLEQFQPGHVALEMPFVNSEYPSGRKTLQALGVINAVVYRYCQVLPLSIYTASWKSHLDSPKAERADIAAILESLFDLKHLPLTSCVDALAIAYAGWCGVGQI
jgi:crossover junction endodeoxyribonuclease RuvC